MQLSFSGDIDEIEAGLAVIGPMLGFQTAPDGLRVVVVRTDQRAEAALARELREAAAAALS